MRAFLIDIVEQQPLNRIRWLILILGPLPIAGSSWAVSSWFKSPPHVAVSPNTVVAAPPGEVFASGGAKMPIKLPNAARAALARDCVQAAARLERELGSQCRVAVCAPFVLGGDLDRGQLEVWHDATIAPALRAMQGRYFSKLPDRPVTVLLFSSEQSYNHYCRKLFGESEISVYGYYKPNLRTLVLNVATGSGTLLHELTHALMDFDFSQAPDWLNEGLASLHEQCRFREDGDGPWIEGLVNWRLAGLQEVIRQGRMRSLESLVKDDDFRGPHVGTNYAQARYFCMYLQQEGLLEDFFKKFRAGHQTDPHGAKTLAELVPGKSWGDLDREFQQWVSQLVEPK